MRPASRLAVLAILVVAALIAGACGDDTDPSSSRSIETGPSGEGRTGDVAGALDRAGIPVHSELGARAATARPQLWQWQVDNMARQYEAGNGFAGFDLDDTIDDIGGVPISFLIAGWISSFESDNAKIARELMGDQLWDRAPSIIFPSIVLTLFVDDAVQASFADGGDTTGSGDEDAVGIEDEIIDGAELVLTSATAVQAQESSGPCSAVIDFVHDGLTAIFDALQIDSDLPIIGWFTDLIDAATELIGDLIVELADIVTEEIAQAIGTALGVVHMITVIADMISPWTVSVASSSPFAAFSLTGGPNNQQTFTADVADPLRVDLEIDWPDELVDCATVLGVPLPDFGGDYSETSVVWRLRWGTDPILGSAVEVDQQFDAEGRAELMWVTGNEESDQGEEDRGVILAIVEPQITVVDDLKAFAQAFVLGFIPSVTPDLIFAEIKKIYDDVTEPVWESLTALLQPTASTDVRVAFHLPEEAGDPTILGQGQWTVLSVVNRVTLTENEISTATSVNFAATIFVIDVGADGVRGQGFFGAYHSLDNDQFDDLLGANRQILKVGAEPQQLALQGDATQLRAVGTIDYETIVNASEGSLDELIGGVAFNPQGMGLGRDAPITTETVEIAGASCGRAGATLESDHAWIAVRSDAGSLSDAVASAGRIAAGRPDGLTTGAGIDQIATAFAAPCVTAGAGGAAATVAELLAAGIT